jgi:hypothetical protein
VVSSSDSGRQQLCPDKLLAAQTHAELSEFGQAIRWYQGKQRKLAQTRAPGGLTQSSIYRDRAGARTSFQLLAAGRDLRAGGAAGHGRRLIASGMSVKILPALPMLGSTYFTSIWAILYVGQGLPFAFHTAAFDRVAGLSRARNIDQRPLQPMGIALSVVTALVGLGQWLLYDRSYSDTGHVRKGQLKSLIADVNTSHCR